MLLRSPLHDRHEALGAKFAAFGGWEMPLEYAGGGVIKEHTAVRTAVCSLSTPPSAYSSGISTLSVAVVRAYQRRQQLDVLSRVGKPAARQR